MEVFQQSKHRQDVLKSLGTAVPKGCAFGVAEPNLLEDGAGLGGRTMALKWIIFQSKRKHFTLSIF